MSDGFYLKRDDAVAYLVKELPGLDRIGDDEAGDMSMFGAGLGTVVAVHHKLRTSLDMPDKYRIALLGKIKVDDTLCYRGLMDSIAHAIHQIGTLDFKTEKNFAVEEAVVRSLTHLGLYEGTEENLTKLYGRMNDFDLSSYDEFIPPYKDYPLFLHAGTKVYLHNTPEIP